MVGSLGVLFCLTLFVGLGLLEFVVLLMFAFSADGARLGWCFCCLILFVA